MKSINKDSFYSIIIFLNNNELKNVSYINKFSNKIIKDNQKIILKNKIIENWGKSIYDMLPFDYKIDKIIKYNIKSVYNILDLFYNSILNGYPSNSRLLISIYDIIYTFTNEGDHNRADLFSHRNKSIIKILKSKNISKIENDDKNINFIINSTRYFNRFCYFLNNTSIELSNKEFIKMLNEKL